MRAVICKSFFVLLFLISLSSVARAQQTEPSAPPPSSDSSTSTTPAPATPMQAVSGATTPAGPMSLKERFAFESHVVFGPGAFIVPALGAGYTMLRPPTNYPHDWSDGPAAYGRIYGAQFGSHAVGGLTVFATADLLHEDPRYYPSTSHRFAIRFVHGILFTLFDQSNNGHRTLAVSNFAGAAASGFVGNLWEPDGFNNTSHALDRASVGMATLAGRNLILEFSPELGKGLEKIHLIHPKPEHP